MAKKCEIKPYIKNLTPDVKLQERLNDAHNSIFDRLNKSKFFRNWQNKLWEKASVKNVNEGRGLVDAINKEYGVQVAKITATQPTKKNYAFVNVRNLLPKFKQGGNQLEMFQLAPNREVEEYVASEKTIRDVAARMSDRIGIPVKFISDRNEKYKGKLEGGIAVVNLAYATLDTPIHEILGHPIIRAIKKKEWGTKYSNDPFMSMIEEDLSGTSQLYQNLLKELEYGKGKEVLDRVKKDYVSKDYPNQVNTNDGNFVLGNVGDTHKGFYYLTNEEGDNLGNYTYKEIITKYPEVKDKFSYTLEEQQEEAIVELLGLMTAEKLDNVKDGKLISLLKRLLKEINNFIKDLLKQREVEIDKLPDNMTLGDISNLLAYSNSKLILPGNEVVYTTPDNQTFKTYAEASNHISELTKSIKDIDLDNIIIDKQSVIGKIDPVTGKKIKSAIFTQGSSSYFSPDENQYEPSQPDIYTLIFEDESSNMIYDLDLFNNYNQEIINFYFQIRPSDKNIQKFINKNREYEQSKEIIEEWKKVNNIKYNPEEIYSRDQEFASVVGAYSSFDVNLMMQNLLQHIEDNEKAGGKFAISAFTKPNNKKLKHIEGVGGKIKIKIHPKSEDILWAANTDVFSGSVWDASEISKDKKSELLGISYTKYPSIHNIGSIQPNLAYVVDKLIHHHNELGIVLTGNNFRLEYDDDIPYETKKIINSINSILDQKYGKVNKPEIKEKNIKVFKVRHGSVVKSFDTYEEAEKYRYNIWNMYSSSADIEEINSIEPTQTYKTLKEDINVTARKHSNIVEDSDGFGSFGYSIAGTRYVKSADGKYSKSSDGFESWTDITAEEYEANKPKGKVKEKEYTSQATINTKIAKLKEVAKKYPRSLIRSKVKPIDIVTSTKNHGFADVGDLPFQKINTTVSKKNIDIKERIDSLLQDYLKANGIKIEFYDSLKNKHGNDIVAVYDAITKTIKVNQGLADETTLPEELGHHITLALGNEHTLVKRALTLLNRIDYKSYLGSEYVKAYQGNENLLKHEALGKLISRYIVNPSQPEQLSGENGTKLWDTIKRLLNAFISLFKPNTNIQAELDQIVKELGDQILAGTAIEGKEANVEMYQLATNKAVEELKPAYVYFKRLINDLNRQSRKYPDEAAANEVKINKIEIALKELEKGNKQLIINQASEVLDSYEEYLNKLKKVVDGGNKPNVDNIEKVLTNLDMLNDIPTLRDKAGDIRENLNKYLLIAAKNLMQSTTGLEETEIDKYLASEDKDISAAEMNFGTLADVKNYIAKTIGLLIKKAQALIEVNNKKSYNEIDAAVKKLKEWADRNGKSLQETYDMFITEHKGTLVFVKPDNKELQEFYNFFKDQIQRYSSVLPVSNVRGGFIPNILETSLIDVLKSDKNVLGKIKDGLNYMLNSDYGSGEAKFVYDESLTKDQVPLKYFKPIEAGKKSKDLGSVLLQFAYFANSYEQMDEILPKTRVLQQLVKDSKFIKNTDKTARIEGNDSNLNKMVEGFIKMQVLGDKRKEEVYAPIVDFFIRYTSLLRIGLNPQNAFTNLLVGNIGNIVEAAAGRFFTLREYASAIETFASQNMAEGSKLNKLVELFNPLMELEDYENLKNIKIGSTEYKEKIKSLMYSFQRMGEKQMQVSTMIAILNHKKVVTKAGDSISMWEAFDEEGKWKSDLMGYKLEDNQLFAITNRIQRINQMIHGRYSAQDQPILMQYALFRMLFQFKKWIPAAVEARLGGERYDARLDATMKGRYRSYAVLFSSKGWDLLINTLTNNIQAAEKAGINEVDVYNMRKNLIEALIIAGVYLLQAGFDDDKKRKDPTYKATMEQLNRLSGDLTYFYTDQPLNTMTYALPTVKTAKDILLVLKNIPAIVTGEEYKRGKHKGENKFTGTLIDIIPGVKPVKDVHRLFNNEPFIEPK